MIHIDTTATAQNAKIVVTSVMELLRSCSIPKDAFNLNNLNCNGEFDEDELDAVDSMDEEEALQMRRLGSWSTLGTMGTSASEATLDHLMFRGQVDVDGHFID